MPHPLECIEAEIPPTMPPLTIFIEKEWGRQQNAGLQDVWNACSTNLWTSNMILCTHDFMTS